MAKSNQKSCKLDCYQQRNYCIVLEEHAFVFIPCVSISLNGPEEEEEKVQQKGGGCAFDGFGLESLEFFEFHPSIYIWTSWQVSRQQIQKNQTFLRELFPFFGGRLDLVWKTSGGCSMKFGVITKRRLGSRLSTFREWSYYYTFFFECLPFPSTCRYRTAFGNDETLRRIYIRLSEYPKIMDQYFPNIYSYGFTCAFINTGDKFSEHIVENCILL